MHGDAADVVAHPFALAGVQPGPDVEAEAADSSADGLGAADGTGRAVKDRQEPIPSGVDLAAVEAADHGVVGLQQVTPAPVTRGRCLLGGPHDIGEQLVYGWFEGSTGGSSG
jgi:hypothetical protein